jgi:glycerol-3-phosphate cytidylyltransferase
VGLQTDPSQDRKTKSKPAQTVIERYLQLRACKFVDEIIPYSTEQDLEDLLAGMHIDVRILGVEYRDKGFTGSEICKTRDIEIYFNERDHRFSSSGLRQHIVDSFKKKK